MIHILPGPGATHDNEGPPKESLFRKIITGPLLAPILIVLGWGPLFLAASVIDILQERGIVGPHFGVGYAMGWGTLIAFPATVIAICSLLFHFLRAVHRSSARG
jgi:hypothetical protein